MRRRLAPVVFAGFACVVIASGCGSSTSSSGSSATGAGEKTTKEAAPQEPEEPKGVGDGTHRVPNEIAPGTYRSTDETTCYWARLKGFSRELNDVIANGNNSPEIVTIGNNDAGFETQGCGDWVPVKDTAPASPATKFGNGTYQVGVHIEPGTYSADGQGTCYWARLSNFSHTGVGGIITNGNNPTTVEIAPSDAGFTTFGCGTWTGTPAPVAASPTTGQPKPKSGFSACGRDVEARAGTTSCAFAQNVFYEFYEASPEREFPVYSPTTGATYSMSCAVESVVTCTGGNGAEVRFPMSAVRAYTEADARAYANSHDLGR
jgi:hypothetical protein